MIIEAITRTTTEVFNGNINIFCSSSINNLGEDKPSIYSSKILENEMVVDNENGIEGELIISSSEDNPAVINSNGELIISLEKDDVNKYSINETMGDLLYEE